MTFIQDAEPGIQGLLFSSLVFQLNGKLEIIDSTPLDNTCPYQLMEIDHPTLKWKHSDQKVLHPLTL